MWMRIVERIDDYERDDGDLGKPVRDLRGLFVEADPHDPEIRSDFEEYWSPIDAEHELRTEPWAPAGAANDEKLSASLDAFKSWVLAVLLADPSDEHD
jgi:hypothetical protein